MSIQLIIDNREKHIIEEMTKTHNIKIEQLDIGDIVFKKNDEIILIIERKTIQDLKASICDGRNREQKIRLLGSGIPVNRITYIIEGNLDKSLNDKISNLPVDTLIGSLINTQYRDNIKVYKTSSLNETINYIKKLLKKLNNDSDNYFKNDKCNFNASDYSSSLKKQKKANITPTVWFIYQLCLIPQITEKIAEEIVKKYPSIQKLFIDYEKIPEHLKEKLLADIKYVLKNGKSRRIGEKISSRVYKFLYNINE